MSTVPDAINHRLNTFRTTFSSHQAVLLSNSSDIRYFSGFETLVPTEREALLLLTHHTADLFHAHFSPFKSVAGIQPTKGCSIQTVKSVLQQLKAKHRVTELLIDESSLFVNEYLQLQQSDSVAALDKQTIWQQRELKDTWETKALAKAATIAKETMDTIIPLLSIGQTEQDIADHIESQLKKLGSEQPAFPTIVAFGPHSALPHHQPTKTVLEENTAVLLDFGATYKGYCSDMTRTVWFGSKPSEKFTLIEQTVKAAYKATLKAADTQSPTAKQLDDAARKIIQQAGFGEQFIHTTGHGVGLDIHEPPSLNAHNTQQLKAGMFITIEPGIYLEEEFGYRHENTIQLTNKGVKEITV